jgi:hypothetical protein
MPINCGPFGTAVFFVSSYPELKDTALRLFCNYLCKDIQPKPLIPRFETGDEGGSSRQVLGYPTVVSRTGKGICRQDLADLLSVSRKQGIPEVFIAANELDVK